MSLKEEVDKKNNLVELDDDDLANWFSDYAKTGDDMTITSEFQRYIAARLRELGDLKVWMRLVESEVDE